MNHQITDPAALDEAMGQPTILLFKHSPICPVSVTARMEYKEFLADNPETPTAWIDVIDGRPLSQDVARRTGITHESPQALWLVQGQVVWHASHGAITSESLHAARPSS